ncbi:Beta-Casp domain family protein [Babesia bovis T2Bo]|uniref:Cleavage and polyadenylation specificity factor subunit 2 n=1 Tax=Babesia bovis TaxID=5865 RepID=A7APS1_BABBO|nr:Beta-Casp domain family protein [Babesia bovis T2Bo]EDO08555.1 Beta-Casp domain family protein [Babesia bovis T2Bo]|eukprot:XP_001612123.1 hypothetical protein [Babesia bovis T2Bo]
MASLIAKPIIFGSLLATKVTLRVPLSYFDSDGYHSCQSDTSQSPTDVGDVHDGASIYEHRPSNRKVPVKSGHDHYTDSDKDAMSIDDTSQEHCNINILVNCGWSLDFEPESIDLLKQCCSDVDVIILTDGDFGHVGALPVIYSWLHVVRDGLGLPSILCTEGCYKFARACLVDVLDNATLSYKFEGYNFSDLDLFYSGCVTLRYRESFPFVKSGEGWRIHISLLPLNNGVSIGGAVWRLELGTRTIVCAPTYRVESVWFLNGCEFDGIRNADVVVTYDQPRLPPEPVNPYVTECNSMSSILSVIGGTLRSHGSVLIPLDVGSQLIDLLFHLNAVWSNSDLQQYPIVLVSPIAVKLILLFGTCLEYMRTTICHNFLRTLWNPISSMKFIHAVSRLDELRRFANRPCVFISTCSSLDFGLSSYLFAALSCYKKNSIIFTNLSSGISSVLGRYHDFIRAGDIDELHYDFEFKLNLEPTEGDAEETDTVDNTDTQEQVTTAGHTDVIMDTFDGELATDFLFKGHRNFIVQGGVATYTTPTVVRDDLEKHEKDLDVDLDYGIPYTNLSRADLDQHIMDPGFPPVLDDPLFGDTEARQPEPVENPFNTYYTHHLENISVGNLFGTVEIPAMDDGSRPTAVCKRLDLVIRSGLYLTHYFSQHRPSCEAVSLFKECVPRTIAMLPGLGDSNTLSVTTQLIRETVPGCVIYGLASLESGMAEKQDTSSVCIPLDLRESFLSRSLKLFTETHGKWQLHQGDAGSLAVDQSAGSTMNRVMSVMRSVSVWKRLYNPVSTFQAIVRLVAEPLDNSGTGNQEIRSTTFWTERASGTPGISLLIPGDDVSDMDDDPGADEVTVKTTSLRDTELLHSSDRSLYVGTVSMPTLLGYVEQCLPDNCGIEGGVLSVTDRCLVSRDTVRHGMHRWSVRGTLDPSFYFSRKMLRCLHNRLEPLY